MDGGSSATRGLSFGSLGATQEPTNIFGGPLTPNQTIGIIILR